MRRLMLISFLLGLIFTGGRAYAAPEGRPAVLHPEAKFEPQHANIDGAQAEAIEASYVFAMSHRWGVQFDALVGELKSDVLERDLRGGGVHLFWRDPDRGMFDINLSNTHAEDFEFSRIELLGEIYWDKRTLTASVGYLLGDLPESSFGGAQLSEYVSDTLTFDINGLAVDSQTTFGIGVDYKTPINGLHLFGHSFVGNNDFDATIVGIRYYFGGGIDPIQVVRDRGLQIQNRLITFTQAATPVIEESICESFSDEVVDGEQVCGTPFSPEIPETLEFGLN